MEEDLILKLRNFSKLSFQSKVNILKKGRPIPDLKNLLPTTGQKKVNRSFHKEWYTRKEWLCGCALRNCLFYYPCLLFSTSDNVWTKTGFCDLKNLPRSLSEHEKSNIHIQSQISFKTFGTSRIDLGLNEQQRLNISLRNSKVKARFHYERGKKDFLFVLLLFLCARFNFNRSLQSNINKREKECSFPRS